MPPLQRSGSTLVLTRAMMSVHRCRARLGLSTRAAMRLWPRLRTPTPTPPAAQPPACGPRAAPPRSRPPSGRAPRRGGRRGCARRRRRAPRRAARRRPRCERGCDGDAASQSPRRARAHSAPHSPVRVLACRRGRRVRLQQPHARPPPLRCRPGVRVLPGRSRGGGVGRGVGARVLRRRRAGPDLPPRRPGRRFGPGQGVGCPSRRLHRPPGPVPGRAPDHEPAQKIRVGRRAREGRPPPPPPPKPAAVATGPGGRQSAVPADLDGIDGSVGAIAVRVAGLVAALLGLGVGLYLYGLRFLVPGGG